MLEHQKLKDIYTLRAFILLISSLNPSRHPSILFFLIFMPKASFLLTQFLEVLNLFGTPQPDVSTYVLVIYLFIIIII